jgi:hypothetical protein
MTEETTLNFDYENMSGFQRIMRKMFCFHRWKSHNNTTEHHSSPTTQGDVIREILVCENCGRIKQIQY